MRAEASIRLFIWICRILHCLVGCRRIPSSRVLWCVDSTRIVLMLVVDRMFHFRAHRPYHYHFLPLHQLSWDRRYLQQQFGVLVPHTCCRVYQHCLLLLRDYKFIFCLFWLFGKKLLNCSCCFMNWCVWCDFRDLQTVCSSVDTYTVVPCVNRCLCRFVL